MAILEHELANLIREYFPSVTSELREAVVDTAIFENGKLTGLYIKPLRRAPPQELDNFLRAARVRMGSLGDPRGDRVYEDYYPTGRREEPCRPKDNSSCWVEA